jgi:hypothetical protein
MEASDLFQVESIESSAAPTGMPRGAWCRYVVANRRSRVVGRYQGTLAQTRRNAERLAESINERARTGRSAWAPNSRTKPRASRARKAVAPRSGSGLR